MKKYYMQPQVAVENVALSSHLLDGSVLNMSGEGGYQEGALAPKRLF
ncbi:MAG: hypothetical protein J6P74_06880 [Paludibacteraceae bacterium]|nr:hypothetical protein [Paludibacteraceae bacterium]